LTFPFKTPQKGDKPAAGKGYVVQRIVDTDKNGGATEVVDDIAQDKDVNGKHLVHHLSVIEYECKMTRMLRFQDTYFTNIMPTEMNMSSVPCSERTSSRTTQATCELFSPKWRQ
jgi:hypothetical protein